jgi:uncharacterized repeat protein (TIGR03847 family)
MTSDDRAHARHDIGVCTILEAEAVGAAGSRRFRLRASGENGSALLWLEKEDLHELAVTVKRMLRSGVQPTNDPPRPAEDDSRADFDFKVARLAIGYDRASSRYMLLAQVNARDEEDAIALWADADVLDRMADQAFNVYESGRPRCPLCGAPLGDGRRHVCPRAN